MGCDEFIERWQTLLDARQPTATDEQLLRHAQDCEECQGLLAAQTILFQHLPTFSRCIEGLSPAAVPVASAARPATAIRDLHFQFSALPEQGRSERPFVPPKSWIAVAVAASLLLLLTLVARQELRWWEGQRPAPQVARLPEPELATPESSESVRDALADEVPREPTPEERAAIQQLMEDVSANLNGGNEQELQSLKWITGGFQPLTNTLGDAWEALRHTIPAGTGEDLRDPQARAMWRGWLRTWVTGRA